VHAEQVELAELAREMGQRLEMSDVEVESLVPDSLAGCSSDEYLERLPQNDAAMLFGVSQPRVSDLMRGKIDLFSVDMLANMAAKAKLEIRIQVRETA
jgi:hypothetical protein